MLQFNYGIQIILTILAILIELLFMIATKHGLALKLHQNQTEQLMLAKQLQYL